MTQGQAMQMSQPITDGTVVPAGDVVRPELVHEINRQSVAGQAIDQGAANVDKIRDILFGSHMRDYETRFTHLEQTLADGLAEIRETAAKRLEAIETYIKNEFETLQARLKGERDDRSNCFKQLTRDLDELSEGLNRRISEVDEQALQAQRQLRLDLLQVSKSFAEDLGRKQDEMALLLDRRFQELRKGKTDRAALATLFMELGMRLNDELQMPGT
jgi:uncharacterized phage infection (PIP) family protein YhgE